MHSTDLELLIQLHDLKTTSSTSSEFETAVTQFLVYSNFLFILSFIYFLQPGIKHNKITALKTWMNSIGGQTVWVIMEDCLNKFPAHKVYQLTINL